MKFLIFILAICFSVFSEDQKYDTLKAVNSKVDSVILCDSLAARALSITGTVSAGTVSASDSVITKGLRVTATAKVDSLASAKGIVSTTLNTGQGNNELYD